MLSNGLFCCARTSLTNEKLRTLKDKVGPPGNLATLRLTWSFCWPSTNKCETPNGCAAWTKSFRLLPGLSFSRSAVCGAMTRLNSLTSSWTRLSVAPLLTIIVRGTRFSSGSAACGGGAWPFFLFGWTCCCFFGSSLDGAAGRSGWACVRDFFLRPPRRGMVAVLRYCSRRLSFAVQLLCSSCADCRLCSCCCVARVGSRLAAAMVH